MWFSKQSGNAASGQFSGNWAKGRAVLRRVFEVQALEKRMYLSTAAGVRRALADDPHSAAYTVNLSVAARHAAKNLANQATRRPASHTVHAAQSKLHSLHKPLHHTKPHPKPHHKPKPSESASVAAPAQATTLPVLSFQTAADSSTQTATSGSTLQVGPVAIPSIADPLYSIVVQKDGKIVVLGAHDGTFSILRYDITGLPDQFFGTSGSAATSFNPGNDTAHALAIDYAGTPKTNPQYGKIVVAGGSSSGFVIARFLTNGTLDPTFGVGGKVSGALAGGIANGLILGPSGNILVGGTDTNGKPVVIRLLGGNGAIDTNFGSGGIFQGPLTNFSGPKNVTPITTTGGTAPALRRNGTAHPFDCSGCGGCSGCSYSSPSISFSSGSYSGTEGTTFSASGTISDPNPNESLSGTVDYGDGTGTQALSISGNTFTLSHAYAEDAGYNIQVSVTDSNDNESGGGNAGITVAEANPSISFSGGNVNEGQTYSNSGSISVDSGDSLSATVNYGDGSGNQTLSLNNGNFTLNHQYHEEGTYGVTVSATSTESSVQVGPVTSVQNVFVSEADPKFTLSGAYHAQVGSTYTLTLSEADSSDSLTNATINWADGSPPASASFSGSTASFTHTFLDSAITDVISASVQDDGTTYSNQLPIAVQQGTLSDPPVTNFNAMFQPWNGFTAGYLEDIGLVFGDHSNVYESTTPYCYGWTTDNRSSAVSRGGNDGPGYDTFMSLPTQNANNTQNKWSIGLANGTYQVTILSGDPNVTGGARYQTYANGTLVLDQTPGSGAARWRSGTATVTVSNGWLTIYSGPNASNNIINTISVIPTAHLSSAPSSAPTNLTAYAESTSAINLNWTDNSDNESGFKIERSTSLNGTYSTVFTTVSNDTYYTDTGLAAGATYYYRVVPTNSVGDCSTYASGSAVTLSSNGEAPYKGTAWPIASSGTSTIQAEDFDTGGANVAYHSNSGGNLGGRYRQTGTGINTGPFAPGYYLGWNAGGSWYNYTVNVAAAGNYRVDFSVSSEGPGGNFTMSLDGNPLTGTLTIPDTSGWKIFETIGQDNVYLPAGVHVLTLKNTSVGNGAEGDYDWFAFTHESSAPAAATNLYAAAASNTTVKLNWTDNATVATGYKVERKTPGGSFSQVGSTLSVGTTSYTDTSASADSSYIYEILATDSSGDSAASNLATVRTPDAVAAGIVASADANVVSSDSSGHYGNPSILKTNYDNGRVFLTFDLSQFGSSVNSAKLRLFGAISSHQTGATVSVYGLSSPPTWTESSITWSNQPAYNTTALATTTVNTDSGHWYEWDIGSYVNQQLAANHKQISVMVEPNLATLSPIQFNARSASANVPLLLVSTTAATVPPDNAVTGLVATPTSSTQINLTWTDNPPQATYIYVQTSTDGVNFGTPTQIAGNLTSDLIGGLSPSTQYWFRLYATVNGNISPYSNVATATTLATVASISGGIYNSVTVPPPKQSTSSGIINLYDMESKLGNFNQRPLPGIGGADYFPPHNDYIVADSAGLQEILRDGKVSNFYTNGLGFGDESSLVIAQAGNQAGFTAGDIFFASGNGITKISSAGVLTSPFARLGGGDTVSALAFDTTGLFGGDLIATSGLGFVYLVDAAGDSTRLGTTGVAGGIDNGESVTVLPNNPALYGPFAGRILIGNGPFFGVDSHGSVISAPGPDLQFGPPDLENLMVVPPNANFFAANSQFLEGATASDFAPYVGQLLGICEEKATLYTLQWQADPVNPNGPGSWISNIVPVTGFVGTGWERAGFGDAGISDGVSNIPPTQAPLGGWTVQLKQGSTVVASTTTGNDPTNSATYGQYSFSNVTPGTYTIQESPPSGPITWVTDIPSAGTYTVTISSGQTVTDIDFLNHQAGPKPPPVDAPPVITSQLPSQWWPLDGSGSSGVTLGSAIPPYTVTATDPDHDVNLTYSLQMGPDGLNLDKNTHQITWTPLNTAQEGYNYGLIRVTDSAGLVAMQPFTIYVNPAKPPGTPTNFQAAIQQSPSGIVLTWQPPNDGSVASSYQLTRTTNPDVPSPYGVTPSSNSTYTDPASDLIPGTEYWYELYSVGLGGASITPAITEIVWPIPGASGSGFAQEQPQVINPTEGTSFNGTVATFTTQGSDPIGDYKATIVWGDGNTTSNINPTSNGSGGYNISGTHTYAEAGNYSMTVTITDSAAGSITGTWSIPVQDRSLSVSAASSLPAQQQYAPFSSPITVASFTDPNSSANTSDYSAIIDWGDGHQTSGSIVSAGSGVYNVQGSYSYNTAPFSGSYTVTTTVYDGVFPQTPVSVSIQVSSNKPPTPAAPIVTQVQKQTIEVQWVPNPALTGYIIYRYDITDSNPANWVKTNITQEPGVSGTDYATGDQYFDQDTSFQAGHTYAYKIQGIFITSSYSYDSSDESLFSSTIVMKSLPPVPTSVTAQAISGTQVKINWTQPADNNNWAVQGWYVLRSQTVNGGYVPITNAGQVAYQPDPSVAPYFYDESCKPGQTYYYEVEAVDIYGDPSPASSAAQAVTIDYTNFYVPPASKLTAGFAGSFTQNGSTTDRIGLTWFPAQTDGLLGYDIYRSTNTNFIPATLIGSSVWTNYVDDINYQSGGPTTYYYEVKAVVGMPDGTEIDSPASNVVSANLQQTVSTPAAPVNVSAQIDVTDNGNNETPTGNVIINWSLPNTTSPVGPPVMNMAGFYIYRGLWNSNPDQIVWSNIGQATINATSYVDTTVLPGTIYTYKIESWNSSGTSAFVTISNPGAEIITPQSDMPAPTFVAPPLTPAAPSTRSDGTWQVKLEWQPVQGADQYIVYRRTATTSYEPLLQRNFTYGYNSSIDFTDDNSGQGLDPSTTYYYVVRATDRFGHISSPSAEMAVQPPPVQAAVVPLTQLQQLPAQDGEQSPTPGISVPPFLTATAPVYGIVEDPNPNDTSLTWTLSLRPASAANSSTDIVLASGTSGVGSISNGTALLADLDPSRFPPGPYLLVLHAHDSVGSPADLTQPVTLKSNVQLGNLTLPISDASFQLPSGGSLPISRSYDSQNVKTNGKDFGNGWRFDLMDSNLHTTVQPEQGEYGTTNYSFRDGDQVYITLPDGSTYSFEFLAKALGDIPPSDFSLVQDSVSYQPEFVPSDGSGATLAVSTTLTNAGQIYTGDPIELVPDGDVFYDVNLQEWYNPASSHFGGNYRLTLNDGSQYLIDATTGRFETMTDPQGDVITLPWNNYSQNSSITYTPQGGSATTIADITREGNGHVTSIDDHNNPNVVFNYAYDSSGNLLGQRDGDGHQTTYATGGELVAPNVPSSGGNTVYAVITTIVGSTTEYWNTGTNAFEAYNSAHWTVSGGYPIAMTASPTNASWYTAAFPTAIAAGTILSISYYRSNAPATSDTAFITQPLTAMASQAYPLLTTATNAAGVEVVQAAYDAAGQITSLQDSLSNKSNIGTGGFDGTEAGQDVGDLVPSFGSTPTNAGDTQTFYDSRGNVARTIQAVKDSNGNIVQYLVTVQQYTYAVGDFLSDLFNGVSNQNALGTETDWQAFSVPASPVTAPAVADPNGLRYTQMPTDSLPPGYATWPHTTKTYGVINDPVHPTASINAGAFRPASTTNYLADGMVQTTTYGWSIDGSGHLIATVTDPYGNISSTTYSDTTMKQVVSSTNAAGETTTYHYDSADRLTQVTVPRGGNALITNNEYYSGSETGSGPNDLLLVTDNAGTTTPGVVAGLLSQSLSGVSSSATGVTTYYAYYPDGTTAATYHNFSDGGGNGQWVIGVNHYDNEERIVEVDTGVYNNQVDSSLTQQEVNDPVNLVGYLKEDITVYNAMGQQSETYTQYQSYNATTHTWSTQPSSGAKFDDTVYRYDAKGELVETVNPDGTKVDNVYDAMGRVIWVFDQFGIRTNTVYDANGRVTTTSKYIGGSISITQDSANPNFYDLSYSAPTTLFSTTSTTYDSSGRTATTVEADGHTTQYTYNTNGSTTVTTASDVSSQASSTTNESDRYQIFLLTPSGSFTTSSSFKLMLTSGTTSQSLTVNGSSVSAVQTALINAINTSNQSLFQEFTASYDTDSQTVHVVQKSNYPDQQWMTVTPSVTATSGETPAFGSQLIHSDWQQDGNGNATITEYDAMGRSYRVDYPDGTFSETLYGANGNPVPGHTLPANQSIIGSMKVQYDQLGNETDTYYDLSGRLLDEYQAAVTDGDPADNGTNGHPNTYNTLVQPHWNYIYDADGNLTQQRDPRGNNTQWTYDALGHQLSHTVPLGLNTNNLPTGLQSETWTYDGYNRLSQYLDFVGNKNASSGNGNKTVYLYNNTGPQAGMLSEVDYYQSSNSGTTPDQSVTYIYDSFSRLSQVNDSGAGSNYYENYSYSQFYPQQVSGVFKYTGWTYYGIDPATGRQTFIKETALNSNTILDLTDYGYDAQGRLASVSVETEAGVAQSASGSTAYNATGGMITVNFPTTLYSYDKDNEVTKIAYPNGTETDYNYANYWTAGSGGVFGTETVINEITSGNKMLSQYVYQFDADRRKMTDTETKNNADGSTNSGNPFSTTKISYTYDALSRATKEIYDYGADDTLSGGAGETTDDYTGNYTYDLDGNRMTKVTDQKNDGTADQSIVYNYDANNELKTEIATSPTGALPAYSTTYSYDNNGSMTQSQKVSGGTTLTVNYFYDLRNRLIRLDPNGDTTYTNGTFGGTTTDDTVYSYDSHNQIFQATGPSGTTLYLVDSNNPTGYSQVLEEKSSSTTSPSTSYVVGLTPINQDSGGTIGYFMPDLEGSTRMLTASASDATGKIVSKYYDYDAFGNDITPPHPTVASTGLASGNIKYVGQYWNSALGEYDDRARFYSPAIGRFTTMDGITLRPGDLNNADLYAYGGNDPLNAWDPTGNNEFGLAGLLAVVGGGMALDSLGLAEAATVWKRGEDFEAALYASGIQFAAPLTTTQVEDPISAGVDSIVQWLNDRPPGAAGGWESAIPVWGSLKNSMAYFAAGRWVWGTIYAVQAITDIFMVKSIARAGFELAGSALGRCVGGCFVAGTPVLKGDGERTSIDQIHVGERVATDGGVSNSGTKAADPNSTEVDPKRWRLVKMHATAHLANGLTDEFDVQAIEPLSQLRGEGAHVGSDVPIPLDVQQMGIPGDLLATIDEIDPCPSIEGGSGRVVLTTVTHVSNYVFNLQLTDAGGQVDDLGVTGYHRFYSETRGWETVDQLHVGELLRGDNGHDVTVTGVTFDPGLFRVYNMTVEFDHVYYVGDLDTLTHNDCAANAAALKAALVRYGESFAAGDAAAHIVPAGMSSRAGPIQQSIDRARAILESVGIGINGEENGFKAVAGNAGHFGTHRNVYLQQLGPRLQRAVLLAGKDPFARYNAVAQELSNLAAEALAGNFLKP